MTLRIPVQSFQHLTFRQRSALFTRPAVARDAGQPGSEAGIVRDAQGRASVVERFQPHLGERQGQTAGKLIVPDPQFRQVREPSQRGRKVSRQPVAAQIETHDPPDRIGPHAMPSAQILVFKPAAGVSPARTVRGFVEALQHLRIDFVAPRDIQTTVNASSTGFHLSRPFPERLRARQAYAILGPAAAQRDQIVQSEEGLRNRTREQIVAQPNLD